MDDNLEERERKRNDICGAYESALGKHEAGIHTVCMDEMTRIQTLNGNTRRSPQSPEARQASSLNTFETVPTAFLDVAISNSVMLYINRAGQKRTWRQWCASSSLVIVIRKDIRDVWNEYARSTVVRTSCRRTNQIVK